MFIYLLHLPVSFSSKFRRNVNCQRKCRFYNWYKIILILTNISEHLKIRNTLINLIISFLLSFNSIANVKIFIWLLHSLQIGNKNSTHLFGILSSGFKHNWTHWRKGIKNHIYIHFFLGRQVAHVAQVLTCPLVAAFVFISMNEQKSNIIGSGN